MQSVILGLLLGLAVGLINFKLLIRITAMVGEMPAKQAGLTVMLGYFLRISLYGAAILGSVMIDWINPLATGAGILAVAIFQTIKYALLSRQ
jgi:hypothetical protein